MQRTLVFSTNGRSTQDITSEIEQVVRQAGVTTGLAHVFIQHTSASLMICENADSTVRRDVEGWMSRHVPDGDPEYEHTLEGPDDMPSHIRSILTGMDLTVPIDEGRLALGTWQGVFLYEHRTSAHSRRVVVTLVEAGGK